MDTIERNSLTQLLAICHESKLAIREMAKVSNSPSTVEVLTGLGLLHSISDNPAVLADMDPASRSQIVGVLSQVVNQWLTSQSPPVSNHYLNQSQQNLQRLRRVTGAKVSKKAKELKGEIN